MFRELPGVWYLWAVAVRNESRELRMTWFKKRLKLHTKKFRNLSFTLWVMRGYWKFLSKSFLCVNHKDCVFSWQNSLWNSQTSCQLLPALQQVAIVSGSPLWTNLTDDLSELLGFRDPYRNSLLLPLLIDSPSQQPKWCRPVAVCCVCWKPSPPTCKRKKNRWKRNSKR